MASKPRLEYPRAIYHVMNRGDRREALVENDDDRHLFPQTLGGACAKRGWEAHAWCPTSSRFHLVAETPRANLAEGMNWLLGAYSGGYHRPRREFGRLFSGQSALAKAPRMAWEDLDAPGWSDGQAQEQLKGAPGKVKIAARLRRETTMSLARIAARLQTGAPAQAVRLPFRHDREEAAGANTALSPISTHFCAEPY